MFRLIRELRQRSVFRGAGFYLLGAWGALQVGDVIVEPAGLPPWSMTALLYLLVLGFPIAMVFSWRYDITDHGIVRAGAGADSDMPPRGLKAADYILLLALFGIGGVALYQLLPIAQQAEAPVSADASDDLQNLNPNSIAVLPFADISQNRDQGFLGDGISDTVMHVLSQIAELEVTARTSSFAFRDRNLSVAEIARALSVAHVLEGSVQKAADKVRIIARLIDARRGTELWSGYYDREIDSVFAIQDEIAREVAAALTTEVLKTGESTVIDEGYRPSLAAYEKFILGKQALARRSQPGARAAAALFEEAVELDPNYALAHAFLAQAIYMGEGQRTRTPAIEKAMQIVARAIDLDPQLAEAHAVSADLLVASRRFPEAQQAVERALKLRPSYAAAYATYATLLFMQGDSDGALAKMRRAIDLDPQEDRYRTQLAQALWSVSRAEEAIAMTKGAIRRNPEVPTNYLQLGRWLRQMGKSGEGAYWERQGAALSGDARMSRWKTCQNLVHLWQEEKAKRCLGEFLEDYPEDVEARQYLAVVTDDRELGLTVMRAAVAADPVNMYRRMQLADWLTAQALWQETIDTLKPVAAPLLAPDPQINDFLTWPLRNLAAAYQGLDQPEKARKLLESGLAYMERRRKLQGAGFIAGIEDVQYLQLLGRTDESLERLQQTVNAGWRFFSYSLMNPFFDPVREDPRFQAAVETIRADMDRQFAWYEEHKDDPVEAMGI